MTSGQWRDSRRKYELPPDWWRIRQRVLARDPWCRLRLDDGCAGVSEQVDHIGNKCDHREANLRGVCSSCHKKRTQQQATEARRLRGRRRPETEAHPGMGAGR